MSILSSFTLFAQDQTTDPFGGLGFIVPFGAIMVLFYFILVRPEKRKRAQMAALLGDLKKNDRIVTAGGIYGTVVNAQKGSEDITIRVDETTNTRLKIVRSSVSRVLSGDVDSAKKNND